MNKDVMINKVQVVAGKIQSNPYIGSITKALTTTVALTIVGGVGSLINGLPIPAYQDFLLSFGLKGLTAIPADITNNLLSVYIVFLVAYHFAKTQIGEGLIAGLISLMSFFIVTPYELNDAGTFAGFSNQWLGGTGMFTAFIVGLLSAKIFTTFVKKEWVIKMPPGVPSTIADSFSGLLPGIAIAFLMLIIRGLMGLTSYESIHGMIFGLISVPLTKLGTSFPALLLIVIIAQILWFVGIHGTMIAVTVLMPILMPINMENLAAYNAGLPIPNMISWSFFATAFVMGSGQTLGLVIAMSRSKSEQYRTLGKLALLPNICSINEPVIFGTPVILNPLLAIPFISMPAINLTAAYVLCKIGVLNYLPGVTLPLGTPVILSGFINGGWRWAIFQVALLILSYFVYLPFFKLMEKKALEAEGQIA